MDCTSMSKLSHTNKNRVHTLRGIAGAGLKTMTPVTVSSHNGHRGGNGKTPACDFVTVDIKIHLKHKNLPIFVRF